MSELDPAFSHHDPPPKQHKKKKRSRDEAQDDGGLVDEGEAKKKRRKHPSRAEPGVNPDASILNVGSGAQVSSVVTEKRRKKGKRKQASGSEDVEENGLVITSTVGGSIGGVDATGASATNHQDAATKERKKKKRKERVDEVVAMDDIDTAARKERKKQRKHQMAGEDIASHNIATADIPPTSLPADANEAVKKKKKKSKVSSIDVVPATGSSHALLDNGNMFPLPSFGSYPPVYPGAQPNLTAVATLDNLPFPNLAFGSNEDVLRALQDLDMSKITGVLKTLSDPAEAANVPLTGLPPSSAPLVPVFPGSSSVSVVSESAPKKSKRRSAVDLTRPATSSGPPAPSDHAQLLATKWMGPTKLNELVKSEGLVYKKGKFSALEIKHINDALEDYRTTRGLTEDDVHKIIWPLDEKQKDTKFWSEITSALSERPIIAVYHYIRRAHHPLKQQGKWRAEEDARLIQAVTSLGQQWEKVAALVGRMATDCRDRYRNHIVDREKRNSGVWSVAEEDELTRIVTEMQKGKNLDTDVFWGKVTELMGGTRSRQQCRIKWTDSLSKRFQNEGQRTRWSPRDAFILIQKIDAQKVQDDTEIAWKAIPDPQWNSWSAHILQRRWLTMKRGVKGYEDMTHSEIMDILRVKNAEIPVKVDNSALLVDSDDDEPRPGSSTGPGTLAGQDGHEETDSDSE